MTDTPSVPFRTPTAAPEAPVSQPVESTPSTQSASSSTDDAPPSLFQAVEQKPYAVKHLGLDLYDGDKDFPDVRGQAQKLDEYVLGQIKARGLKDDSSSYKEVIDAIYKQIGKSPNEDPVKALRRLTVAAGAISRLESAKLAPVLSAGNLSVSEYEDIQP